MLETIKKLLGIDNTDLDEKLNAIISLTESRLKVLLGGADTVPDSLKYIITEVSIVRFNRIGSEGVSSHSVEGESMNWNQDDDFKAYQTDIEAYLLNQSIPTQGKIKFI